MKRSVVAALVLLAACHADASPRAATRTDTTAPDTLAALPADPLMQIVLPAAAVANGVRAMPSRADSILAANGFGIERYEATLYQIAADSVASRFFESALGR